VSAARRSLLTATVAGTLLGALWFVPSANATQDKPAPAGQRHLTMSTTSDDALARTADESSDQTSTDSTSTDSTTVTSESAASDTRLADTGSVNTTPYVVGGTLFLGLGAGFVTYSVRRERATAY